MLQTKSQMTIYVISDVKMPPYRQRLFQHSSQLRGIAFEN